MFIKKLSIYFLVEAMNIEEAYLYSNNNSKNVKKIKKKSKNIKG